MKVQELIRQKSTIDVSFKRFNMKVDREAKNRQGFPRVRSGIEETLSLEPMIISRHFV